MVKEIKSPLNVYIVNDNGHYKGVHTQLHVQPSSVPIKYTYQYY